MVGQYLPETNEKCYSVRCDPFYHHFTNLNTASVVQLRVTDLAKQAETPLVVLVVHSSVWPVDLLTGLSPNLKSPPQRKAH